MWILPHDLPVLACTGFTLVSVDDQVPWLGIILPTLEVHETPLHPRRKPCTSSSSQTRRLDLGDKPIMVLEQDLLGLVPIAIFHRRFDVRTMMSIEVSEDTVLIFELAGV